jgi:hypothetical protein
LPNFTTFHIDTSIEEQKMKPNRVGTVLKTTKKLILLNKIGVNIIVVGNHLEKDMKNFKIISNYLMVKNQGLI